MDVEQTARALEVKGWDLDGEFPDGETSTVLVGDYGGKRRIVVHTWDGKDGDESVGEPLCQVVDNWSEMSLWVRGIPTPEEAWNELFGMYDDLLVHEQCGEPEYVLDLESGEVIPEGEALGNGKAGSTNRKDQLAMEKKVQVVVEAAVEAEVGLSTGELSIKLKLDTEEVQRQVHGLLKPARALEEVGGWRVQRFLIGADGRPGTVSAMTVADLGGRWYVIVCLLEPDDELWAYEFGGPVIGSDPGYVFAEPGEIVSVADGVRRAIEQNWRVAYDLVNADCGPGEEPEEGDVYDLLRREDWMMRREMYAHHVEPDKGSGSWVVPLPVEE